VGVSSPRWQASKRNPRQVDVLPTERLRQHAVSRQLSADYERGFACADTSDEHVELLQLDKSGIRVAAYLTDLAELPPKKAFP
jgi:hypothetical protein